MTVELTIESSFVSTPYGTFHAESAGHGAPWLFIHGGSASAREWRLVLPGLGECARCVAIDRLGCGESDRSQRGYDRDTLTASLFAFADAMAWDRFGVVGQSFGGFWGLSMAFAQPERLLGLVVVNGAGGPMTDAEVAELRKRQAARSQQREPTTDAEREAGFDRTIQEIFADPSRVSPSFRDTLRWQADHAEPGQFAAVASDWPRLGREPYDMLTVPTLVVWGEADSMVPVDRGHRLAQAIPNARFVGLPGVGHTCQIEAPAEFIAAVAPFLKP
jgi:pimeloyl-ACP methyl ester carboxylesterase